MPMLPKSRPMPWIKKAKPYEGAKRSFDYSSTTWRKVRLIKLKLNPLCELCEMKGIVKEANTVDHRQSIQSGGDPYEMENLQSLCRFCHDCKTAAEIKERLKQKRDGCT